MDSVTQAVLGACVGEAALGKKAGNKALLWGAIGGTIPDLDVLLNFLMDDVRSTLWHRTFSHSLFVLALVTPLLGLAVHQIYRRRTDISWRDWNRLFFWSLLTHPLLDAFTNYGTMLFFPFSDYRVSWRTIFIIDPLYTLPLLVATGLLFFTKNTRNRKKLATLALGISTGYLAITCMIKVYVDDQIKGQLPPAKKFMTTPAFFNTLLWSVVVKEEDGYQVGYYALTDDNPTISLKYIPQHAGLLGPYLKTEAVTILEDLIQFSEGYYTMEEAEKGVILNDLRFGLLTGWFDLSGDYIFSFYIYDNLGKTHIVSKEPERQPEFEDIRRLIQRTQGK